MAKFDVESAYRYVPVHPSDHYLLEMKWRNQHYIDLAPPFGLRSTRCIFNSIADMVEWILVHLYHILPALLHCLDDLIAGFATMHAELEYCTSSLQMARPAPPSREVWGPCNSACSIGN